MALTRKPEPSTIHGLSATKISSYHHYQCDLSLFKSYHGEKHNVSKTGAEQPELVKAQLGRGIRWESLLFSWLEEQGVLARIPSNVLNGIEIQSLIELDERENFYISGLHFYPPVEVFKQEYERNQTQMPQFSVVKPDLVEIRRSEDGSIRWQVIDAKSSLHLRTSHLAQISFYHRCMECLLPAPRFLPIGTVSVWLLKPLEAGDFKPSFEDIKPYPVELVAPILDNFLFRKLPLILAQKEGDVKWHFNPLCRGCPSESSCRARAIKGHELGAMANISVQDAEVLRTLLELGRPAEVSITLSDIEDLDLISRSMQTITKLRVSHPSIVRRAQTILALPTKTSLRIQESPVIAAALSGKVQVTQRRNYTFPKSEDIAIVISLVNDPSTLSPMAFGITVHSSKIRRLPIMEYGKMEQFILRLSEVLKAVMGVQQKFDPPLRTQCYVFLSSERDALQNYLINAALTSDQSDTELHECLKLCIGAICEGAALLSTAFQPLILSAALLDFMGNDRRRTVSELRTFSERLGLPTSGDAFTLLSRIEEKINRLKAEGNRVSNLSDAVGGIRRTEIGLLPRVVVVKREMQQLLALPIPGYWDLSECYPVLCPDIAEVHKCPTDEQLFADLLADDLDNFGRCIKRRNTSIYIVVKKMRSLASSLSGVNELLVNEAKVLSSSFMDVCRQDHLRKLFHMQQFEVLAKLTTMWQDRIEGCPDSPTLEYRHASDANGKDSHSSQHTFLVKSGAFQLDANKDRTFYQFILTEDTSSIYGDNESIPVEAFFDDLAVFNTLFPLEERTRSKWLLQPSIIQHKLLVVDVADLTVQGNETIVTLRTYGNLQDGLVKGRVYRLSSRLVDFNLVKVLSTLLELDLQVPTLPVAKGSDEEFQSFPPFLQLCVSPHKFSQNFDLTDEMSNEYVKSENAINSLFRELQSLHIEHAASLIFKPSQNTAMHRILTNRLSVIWGPPGTGKSYTMSLSILRLLEVCSRHQNACPQIIILSTLTNAALQACMDKLQYLRSCYCSIPHLSKNWLENTKIEHVINGFFHHGPQSGKTYVYVGTVFQLYTFCKRSNVKSDCVFIDEAGQLGLGLASLVLRSLKTYGRVVVAGDNEQLAPILSAEYPVLESRLFGSILDSLMRPLSQMPSEKTTGRVVQLTENFRFNEDLGEFVSTIYREQFKSQRTQNKKVAESLKTLETFCCKGRLETNAREFLVALSKAMLGLPQTTLSPPTHKVSGLAERHQEHRSISLSLLCTEFLTVKPGYVLSYEDHVKCEASLAAAIVKLINSAFPGESIFVATPHRLQRHAVKGALRSQSDDLVGALGELRLSSSPKLAAPSRTVDLPVRVDTIERLQGTEAAFVICLFSHPSKSDRAGDVQFLLQRRRLNVAISRARTLCVLVTSEAVLNPDPRVFANAESMKGYKFLKDFEKRAWTGKCNVALEDLSNR